MTFSSATVTARAARGPAFALAGQGVLLVALGHGVGLTAAGSIAAAAYASALLLILTVGLSRAGMGGLGPANRVTLGRASLIAGVTALVVTSIERPVPTAVLVTLAGVALAMDGLDGYVARRTGSVSGLGARFDMEIDAYLILVLSVYAAASFGWWAVLIGIFRYAFLAATRVWPWLRAPLRPRYSRKAVAALQGVVLAVAATHLLPVPLTRLALAAALGALTWSFVRDIAVLARSRATSPADRGPVDVPRPRSAIPSALPGRAMAVSEAG